MSLTATPKGTTRYLVATLFVSIITVVFIGITLSSLRNEAVQTHRHIANLHAHTFDEHFSQILEQINHTLERIPLLNHDITSPHSLSPTLEELLHNAPYLRSLSLINKEGIVLSSSYAPNIGTKVDTANFLPIPFGQTPLLRIGVPHNGRDWSDAHSSTPENPIALDAIHFLPVIKKVFFLHDEYAIIANINTSYLTHRYIHSLPQEQGYVSLWRLDGILLFSTDPALHIGMSHYNASHPHKEGESHFEHLTKNKHSLMNAFRLARIFPFITEINLNETRALGYWDKERSKILWLSTLLITLCGFLGLMLVLRYYREIERQKEQLAYNKQFRIAMEATQTGLWTWNMQTNAITWDPQCYLLLGYEPYSFDVSLEKIYALTHPDDASAMFLSIKEQVLAHGSFLIERRMKNVKNEWLWMQVRGKVIEFTPEHDPVTLTGVYINIDAQKKAEQLHLSAVAFETQEAILITDAKEMVLKVNEAFTRITGYCEAEILGKTPRVLNSGKHDKAFYDQMWKSLHEKGFWQGELWNKRKNGEIYAEYLTITAIRNKKGVTTHYLANFNDITSHKIAQKQIHEMAYHDPLTHLANRVLLLENIQNALIKQLASHHYAALIFIDLDYFKELNDTHGHDAGDMLLIQVAKRLQESIRQSDTVARLGGDEFVILLENLGNAHHYAHLQAESIAHKVLAYLCKPYALAQGNYTIGASLGCTLFSYNANKDAQTLIKEADNAMYDAKESGRNKVCFYKEKKE